MAEPNERDAKLIQYLNEAYGKEQELEQALQAHITLTSLDSYRKRLERHLKETKAHSKSLERRIKKLGGDTAITQTITGKAMATVKAPLHAIRGADEEERQLKNAKTEYSEEAEEIATYHAIEALAENVGDKETAKLAKTIRRDEERMAKYLEGLIPQLARAVVRAQIPSDQRQTTTRRRSSSRTSSTSRSGGSSSTRGRASQSRSRSSSSSSKSRSTTGSNGRSTSARSSSGRSGSSRRTSSGSSRNGSGSTSRKRSTSSSGGTGSRSRRSK